MYKLGNFGTTDQSARERHGTVPVTVMLTPHKTKIYPNEMQKTSNKVATGRGGRTKEQSLTPGRGESKGQATKQQQVFSAPTPVDDNHNTTRMCERWLHQALTCLGHPQPEFHVQNVFGKHSDDTAKEALQQVVVWLEDRCIRLWDLERRDRMLRHPTTLAEFLQVQLPVYLQTLDCPPSYYGGDWYADPQQRYRVLHWLVSCALQEVSADQTAAVTTDTPSRKATAAATTTDSLDTAAFPLGFSTGDSEVDRVLTILRMQLVASMQREQQAINRAVLLAVTEHRTAAGGTIAEQPKLKPSFQRNNNNNNRKNQYRGPQKQQQKMKSNTKSRRK